MRRKAVFMIAGLALAACSEEVTEPELSGVGVTGPQWATTSASDLTPVDLGVLSGDCCSVALGVMDFPRFRGQ
jgi:hypothetical protein